MSVPGFLADEDLRFAIVLAVRRMEPTLEFTTVQDEGIAGATDLEVLERAESRGLIVVSHDINTMKAHAEERVRRGVGVSGLFLVPQSRPTRPVAECLVLVWAASNVEDWRDRIIYLPF